MSDINEFNPETTETVVESGLKSMSRAEILAKAREAKANKKEVIDKESTPSAELEKRKIELLKRRKESMLHLGPLYIPSDLLDPSLHYHWEEDVKWNVGTAMQAGYDFVQADSDDRWSKADLVIKSEKYGTVVGRISSSYGHISYLLCMPEDLWQAVHKAECDQYNDQINKKSKQLQSNQYVIKDEQQFSDRS